VTAEDLGTAMTGAASGHIESEPEALAEAQAIAAEGTEAEGTDPSDTADDPQAGE
jgi:simple sugar transport system ATP-binding protein